MDRSNEERFGAEKLNTADADSEIRRANMRRGVRAPVARHLSVPDKLGLGDMLKLSLTKGRRAQNGDSSSSSGSNHLLKFGKSETAASSGSRQSDAGGRFSAAVPGSSVGGCKECPNGPSPLGWIERCELFSPTFVCALCGRRSRAKRVELKVTPNRP